MKLKGALRSIAKPEGIAAALLVIALVVSIGWTIYTQCWGKKADKASRRTGRTSTGTW